MPYKIIRLPLARRDIRQYFRHLKREAGENVSRSYLAALEHDIRVVIADSPHVFLWFHGTGEPYRAKLFKLAPFEWAVRDKAARRAGEPPKGCPNRPKGVKRLAGA